MWTLWLSSAACPPPPPSLQVHVDPLAQQRSLRVLCQQRGVQLVAYSSLGTQWGLVGVNHTNPVLSHPAIQVGGVGRVRA